MVLECHFYLVLQAIIITYKRFIYLCSTLKESSRQVVRPYIHFEQPFSLAESIPEGRRTLVSLRSRLSVNFSNRETLVIVDGTALVTSLPEGGTAK